MTRGAHPTQSGAKAHALHVLARIVRVPQSFAASFDYPESSA
jgi:hypothetical protein